MVDIAKRHITAVGAPSALDARSATAVSYLSAGIRLALGWIFL